MPCIGTLPVRALFVAALAPTAVAQGPFDLNWANMEYGTFTGAAGIVPDSALFGAILGGSPAPGFGPGDTIRVCYGIDTTQGGRNQSESRWEALAFQVQLGYSNSASPFGIPLGVVSLHSASVDSLDGDACFSSLFAQGSDSVTGNPITLNSRLEFVAALGVLPVPTGSGIYDVRFQFLGSTGVTGATTLGTDASGFPLLTNLIYELQGPLNGGGGGTHYFLYSTSETVGTGVNGVGTGGVTNGNGRQASAILGSTADLTGAISHNRMTAYAPGPGLIGTTVVPFTGFDTDVCAIGMVALKTPFLWAVQEDAAGNPATGGGAPDWRISGPVSVVDLRATDVVAPLEAAANPGIIFNAPFFLWSATPAGAMLQQPMSWDTSSGTAQPGSSVLGPQLTARAGAQTVPANFDAVMLSFLSKSAQSFGGDFLAASTGPSTGLTPSGQGTDEVGMGTLSAGAFPLAPAPAPGLAGVRLGIAAVGLQFDVLAPSLSLTELASGLTIVLQ